MYRILIADDERRERVGLAKLIKKYQYPLEVVEAQNGEEALAMFEKMDIDILLTDIKMPFMTGLELIEQVRKKGHTPFCIIFSAYGEFEYAQNAIALGVIQYLLKPICLGDFQELFDRVCRLCEEKQKKNEETATLEAERKNRLAQESFRSFLLYLEEGLDPEEQRGTLERLLGRHRYRILMLASYSFLFSIHWKEYREDIRQIVGERAWIINMNDSQLLLLVPVDQNESDQYIRTCCEKLIDLSKNKHQFDVFIAAGPVCKTLDEMKAEFEKLRETMDYQFFMTDSSFLLYDKDYPGKKQCDMLPAYFSKILTDARLRDHQGIIKEFDNVFRYIDETTGFSSVYIKYSFTDMMRKMCEIMNAESRLMEVIEKIYEARSLERMKQVVTGFVRQLAEREEEAPTDNRLVYMAKKVVSERYQDISFGVAAVAEKLHVSPAYLSTLFKMETGQTLVKYITSYRMEQAKCLLETTNMKVADVAEKSGYLNPSYFISLFRNREGCSPQQYREKRYSDEKA